MSQPQPLKIEQIGPRFSQLLTDAGTSLDAPTLDGTWRAFAAFCHEPLACDDERLFFEADLSGTSPDSFYVHFARTCYGRLPMGHLWSHEVIGDFLFLLDDALEEFSFSFETEEFSDNSIERDGFFRHVGDQTALWQTLASRTPLTAQIYIGES